MSLLSTAIAHLLFVYALLGHPLLERRLYRSVAAALKTHPEARRAYYVRVLLVEWGWVLLIALMMATAGLPLEALGLLPPDIPSWVLIGTIAVVMLFMQRGVTHLSPGQGTVPERLQPAEVLLPASREERWAYTAMALTAAICEELLFRGFLWIYLSRFFPFLPVWGIAVISSVMFGLGRLYQGVPAFAQAGLTGGILFFLYWFSGNLIPAMIFHALVELRVVIFGRKPV